MKSPAVLNKALLQRIFDYLDHKLSEPLNLVVGGAGALILAYQYTLGTRDIDVIPFKTKLSASDIDRYVRDVGTKFGLPPDWLNTYFQTFAYVLPKSYGERLILVYEGKKLRIYALGPEDLLILKCFAGREKDIGHSRLLMKVIKNIDFVEKTLQELMDQGIPRAREAFNFFHDLRDDLGL